MALTNDLRISLPFNNDWLDKSGNGNNVIPNGIIFDGTNKHIGSHSAFGDGINDEGVISDSASLDLDYLTAACWVKYTEEGFTTDFLFERGNGTPNNGDWGLTIQNGRLKARLRLAGANRVLTSTTVDNDDAWHLAIIIYDGSYIRLFVDNVYVVELAASHGVIPASSDVLTLFARTGNLNPYEGNLDSFLVWGRALSFGGVSIGQQAIGELAEVWNVGIGIEIIGVSIALSRGRMINLGGNLGGLTKSTLNNLGGL